MEEKIKRVASRTKMVFVYFWMLPVFLVAFGETAENGLAPMREMCALRILRRLLRFCLRLR